MNRLLVFLVQSLGAKFIIDFGAFVFGFFVVLTLVLAFSTAMDRDIRALVS